MNNGFAFGNSGDADVQEAADDGTHDENDNSDIVPGHHRFTSPVLKSANSNNLPTSRNFQMGGAVTV